MIDTLILATDAEAAVSLADESVNTLPTGRLMDHVSCCTTVWQNWSHLHCTLTTVWITKSMVTRVIGNGDRI